MPGMVTQTCHPSTQEAEGAGLSGVPYSKNLCRKVEGRVGLLSAMQVLGGGTGLSRQVTVLLVILSQPPSHSLTFL